MMAGDFKILLDLTVKHSYFRNNECTCIYFKPFSDSEKLLKRFDFYIKQKPDGFGLYSGSGRDIKSLLEYVTVVSGATAFDFEMRSSNPVFSLFTDLPMEQKCFLVYNTGNFSEQGPNETELTADVSNNTSASCIGSLKINFSDLVKQEGEDNKYYISFNARATQWQYYIINKSEVPADHLQVTGKPEVKFNNPENVNTLTGDQALLFSSGSNLIPLCEESRYAFDLVRNPSTVQGTQVQRRRSARVIFKGLPNPDPERFGIITLNGKKRMSSPMYIYI